MRININAKGMQITDSMKERLEKKLNKMDRYFRSEPDVQVRLSQEKGARNIAEITLNVGGVMIRAQETSSDMYQSLDRASDRLEKQLLRHRTRLEKKGNLEPVVVEEQNVPAWEDTPDELVRVKRFTVKPMSVEDAIAQMDMLGHSFFVFVNDETNITSVIYRRTDGGIGMLEPVLG